MKETIHLPGHPWTKAPTIPSKSRSKSNSSVVLVEISMLQRPSRSHNQLRRKKQPRVMRDSEISTKLLKYSILTRKKVTNLSRQSKTCLLLHPSPNKKMFTDSSRSCVKTTDRMETAVLSTSSKARTTMAGIRATSPSTKNHSNFHIPDSTMM